MAIQNHGLNGETPFKRNDTPAITASLQQIFKQHFAAFGCQVHQEAITSDGTVDPSVRFIGSHISVLKPYIANENLPEQGLLIVQKCIRTHGLKNLTKQTGTPAWGSYFISLGALVPFNKLHEIVAHTHGFFLEALGLNRDDVIVRVSTEDKDLLDAIKKHFNESQVEADSMPESYYRHTIGMDGVHGRNFNIAIRDQESGNIADVGNIIILEKNGLPYCVEVALGVSTILKQIFNLGHVQDCHPFSSVLSEDAESLRKFEDAVITCTHLFREGLRPSNKNGRTRILIKYLRAMKHLAVQLGLNQQQTAKVLEAYEELEYSKVLIAGLISQALKKY